MSSPTDSFTRLDELVHIYQDSPSQWQLILIYNTNYTNLVSTGQNTQPRQALQGDRSLKCKIYAVL